MDATYFVAVPFDCDPEGELKPRDAQELPSAARLSAGLLIQRLDTWALWRSRGRAIRQSESFAMRRCSLSSARSI